MRRLLCPPQGTTTRRAVPGSKLLDAYAGWLSTGQAARAPGGPPQGRPGSVAVVRTRPQSVGGRPAPVGGRSPPGASGGRPAAVRPTLPAPRSDCHPLPLPSFFRASLEQVFTTTCLPSFPGEAGGLQWPVPLAQLPGKPRGGVQTPAPTPPTGGHTGDAAARDPP